MPGVVFDSKGCRYLWPDGALRSTPPNRMKAVIDDPTSPLHGQTVWLTPISERGPDEAARNDAMQRIT